MNMWSVEVAYAVDEQMPEEGVFYPLHLTSSRQNLSLSLELASFR